MDPNRITYFGETDFRNQRTRFGIKAVDRAKHVYIIGKSGMGKSTLLENMAAQDIQNGEGMAIIDPHGGSAEKMLHYIPDHRINDVVYFAPFDLEYPIALNVMEDVGPDKRHLVAAGLMSAFKRIWVDAWSARMEYILNNTILALLEYPGATLLSVNKMLSDKSFRKEVIEHITDPSVRSFWVDEFANYTERMAQEAVPAIQNKVGQFTANPIIRNIVGQTKSSFDFREAMDTKKIIIINLSKGRIGEQNASLLGALLITKIYLSAMSRADVSESLVKDLPSFNLFVDEFQSFASDSFANILAEARKYKLCLHLAHQYVEQMSEQVRAAVFGNVGTMIVFRVGSTDAMIFEKEFAPVFMAEDIVNLDFAQMYLRMSIDGIGSKPFSAKSLGPIAPPAYSNKDYAIESSRKNYAKPRADVEEIVRTLLETKPKEENKRPKQILEDKIIEAKKQDSKQPDDKMKKAFSGILNAVKNKDESNDIKQTSSKDTNQEIIKTNIDNNLNTNSTSEKKDFTINEFKNEKKSFDKNSNQISNQNFTQNQKPKPVTDSSFTKTSPVKIEPKLDRSAKPESMSALKDFLSKVVSESASGKDVESINSEIKLNTNQVNQQTSIAEPEPKKDFVSRSNESEKQQNNSINTSIPKNTSSDTQFPDSVVKEVPEDVLKRILNQE